MISDDDLLLYYYRDGLDVAERARIATALSNQPELAQRLHRLVAQLDAAASTPDVPVPAHIQQRWESALDRAAHATDRGNTTAAKTSPRFFTAFRWQAAAAAVAGVTAVLVTIQIYLQPPQQTADVVAPASTPLATSTSDASAYERGLRWHLASTEQRLAALDSAPLDERARLVEAIIQQNRMYVRAAELANEPELARVLRGFAPILESLAAEPRDSAASDIAQLNFELRVIQARLRAAADTSSTAKPIAF